MSQLDSGAFFMLSNVRYGSIGVNFDNFEGIENSTISSLRYNSVFNDGKVQDVGFVLTTTSSRLIS